MVNGRLILLLEQAVVTINKANLAGVWVLLVMCGFSDIVVVNSIVLGITVGHDIGMRCEQWGKSRGNPN